MKLVSESHQWALEPKLKLPHDSFLSRIHSFIHWDISSLRAGIFVGCDPHCVPSSQNSPDKKEAVHKHSFNEWMVGSASIFSSHLMTIDVGNFNREAAQWKRPKTWWDLCAYEHCRINESELESAGASNVPRRVWERAWAVKSDRCAFKSCLFQIWEDPSHIP